MVYFTRTAANLCIILHCCGLASSIVSEEGGYLSVIEPQGQPVYSQFVSVAVDLHQILDVNARLDVAWFLLDTYGCQGDKENDA